MFNPNHYVAGFGLLAAAWGCVWYASLTPAQQDRFNELVKQFARDLFQKAVEELLAHEMKVVRGRARQALSSN